MAMTDAQRMAEAAVRINRLLKAREDARSPRQRAIGASAPPRKWWTIYVDGKPVGESNVRNASRGTPAPLPPKIKARIESLEKVCAREHERTLRNRMAKLGIFKAPKPAHPLDALITSQVKVQPERDRQRLRSLYNGFVAYNESFFGGRLKLPILELNNLENNAIACCWKRTPALIQFDRALCAGKAPEWWLDALLHEMIHAALYQFGGLEKSSCKATGGHHNEFAKICNRIAKERGWPDVCADVTSGPKAARYWPPRMANH